MKNFFILFAFLMVAGIFYNVGSYTNTIQTTTVIKSIEFEKCEKKLALALWLSKKYTKTEEIAKVLNVDSEKKEEPTQEEKEKEEEEEEKPKSTSQEELHEQCLDICKMMSGDNYWKAKCLTTCWVTNEVFYNCTGSDQFLACKEEIETQSLDYYDGVKLELDIERYGMSSDEKYKKNEKEKQDTLINTIIDGVKND